MKNSITILLFMILMETSVHAITLHVEIPRAVQSSLDSLFPKASGVLWKKKGLNKYEADFNYDNRSVSLIFTRKGILINSKADVDWSDIPTQIQSEVKKDYRDYKIIYCMKRWVKGINSYEIEVMEGRNIYVLNYDAKGMLLDKDILQKIDLLNPPLSSD